MPHVAPAPPSDHPSVCCTLAQHQVARAPQETRPNQRCAAAPRVAEQKALSDRRPSLRHGRRTVLSAPVCVPAAPAVAPVLDSSGHLRSLSALVRGWLGEGRWSEPSEPSKLIFCRSMVHLSRRPLLSFAVLVAVAGGAAVSGGSETAGTYVGGDEARVPRIYFVSRLRRHAL